MIPDEFFHWARVLEGDWEGSPSDAEEQGDWDEETVCFLPWTWQN